MGRTAQPESLSMKRIGKGKNEKEAEERLNMERLEMFRKERKANHIESREDETNNEIEVEIEIGMEIWRND